MDDEECDPIEMEDGDDREPAEFKLTVGTYNVVAYPDEVARGELEDYGDPQVPVLVRECGAIRVVLGAHDFENCEKPDLFIERQPNGWLIILHPEGGGDPSGYVFFHDDGNSYLMRDDVTSIRILESGDERPYRMNLPAVVPNGGPLIVDDSRCQAREDCEVAE